MKKLYTNCKQGLILALMAVAAIYSANAETYKPAAGTTSQEAMDYIKENKDYITILDLSCCPNELGNDYFVEKAVQLIKHLGGLDVTGSFVTKNVMFDIPLPEDLAYINFTNCKGIDLSILGRIGSKYSKKLETVVLTGTEVSASGIAKFMENNSEVKFRVLFNGISYFPKK